MNGVHLYFDVENSGLLAEGGRMRELPVLLLLHGGPGHDHSSFKPEFAALADVAQVVYLDLRGNGRSEAGEPSDWNLARWASDVREFCGLLSIERPIVLGQSFGGEVALKLASAYPDVPGKLILLSVTARLRLDRSLGVFERIGGPRVRDIAARYWGDASSEAHARYYAECLPLYTTQPLDPDVRARAIVRENVARHYNGGEAVTINLLPELGNVRARTLILAGTDDPITTFEDAQDIVAAIPPGLARLHRLEGARHGPVRERPREALEAIRQFIQEADPHADAAV
ncbi:MAG: alpha/beta hydrolase [Gammaproteobacteria bacterium]